MMNQEKIIRPMDKELNIIIETIKEAGNIVLSYYGGDDLDTKYKLNEFDPVTQADLEAERYINQKIRESFPNDKILSEETENELTDFIGRIWMIDPLDGTKDFIGKGGRYSIMIGLCVDGVPELGVVLVPATGDLYYAKKGKGSYLMNNNNEEEIKKLNITNTNTIPESRYFSKSRFSESRITNEKIEEALPFKEILHGGSVGIVLGEIASGKGECYILTNDKACKRDSCAPQIILEEAGGIVTDVFGEKINYLTKTKKINNLLVATNGLIHQDVIGKTKQIFKKD